MKKKNQVNGRHVYLKFVATIICAAAVGAVFGFGVSYFGSEALHRIPDWLNEWLGQVGLWSFLPGFLLLLATTVQYFRGKKCLGDPEDEPLMEIADERFSSAMLFSGAATPWMLIAMSLSFLAVEEKKSVLILILMILVYVTWLIAMEALLVRGLKETHPEKQGNVFDYRFQKDWYQSCDEAERQQIGQCSYESFKFMSKVFMVVMTVMCLMSLFEVVTPVCIVLVGLLWLVQQLSYTYSAQKLNYQSRK